jgi:hypothetical protein
MLLVGLGSLGSLPVVLAEVLWFVEYASPVVLVSLSLPTPKPVKCHNCKLKDNKFLNMDDSLIAEVVSVFSAPPPVVLGLVCPQPSPIAQPPIAVENETALVQSQKWPVGFGFRPSLELVVRDHGGNF